jgi:hypothetical protein
MATRQSPEQRAAIDILWPNLVPGDTLYTILRHVSRSGMQREIDIISIKCGGISVFGSEILLPEVRHWSHVAARALGRKIGPHNGIKIGGAGMDMGFALVYELSSVLWPDGFMCVGDSTICGKRCPSNDHSNGDRNYTAHLHRDGGYALRQAWI